ncbi:MAG: FAD binding domain-containing protein [Terrimicrobiaceae bacterium]
MDLNTITEIQRPNCLEDLKEWKSGYAYLAGGTWLFSEPQVNTHTLIDLDTLQWPSLVASDEGLEIASTCKVVDLDRFAAPPEWIASPLLSECCHSFLASFKIWNEASVGGNIIMSLPAGPMISLTAALEGVITLWPREGGPRQMPVVDFVTGNHQNVLQPGELVRSIFLPAHALKKKHAFRRFTLTHLGRSETLIIGTRCPEHGEVILTITASTLRPIQFTFEGLPSAAEVKAAIDGIPLDQYLADTHGSPEHRRHLTYYFSEQIRQELSA